MNSGAYQGQDNLWDKFTKSTKAISTTFGGSSSKSETDGKTVETTVIHKALVRFYKEQVPFQGFPGWLGHKEDLPDEQKILKKQMETAAAAELKAEKEARAQEKAENSSGFVNSLRSLKLSPNQQNQAPYENLLEEEEVPSQPVVRKPLQKRPTAGMAFQSIYNNNSGSRTPDNMSFKRSNSLDTRIPGSQPKENSIPNSPDQQQQRPNMNSQPSSSMMMRDRLKRNSNRTAFGFQ